MKDNTGASQLRLPVADLWLVGTGVDVVRQSVRWYNIQGILVVKWFWAFCFRAKVVGVGESNQIDADYYL